MIAISPTTEVMGFLAITAHEIGKKMSGQGLPGIPGFAGKCKNSKVEKYAYDFYCREHNRFKGLVLIEYTYTKDGGMDIVFSPYHSKYKNIIKTIHISKDLTMIFNIPKSDAFEKTMEVLKIGTDYKI